MAKSIVYGGSKAPAAFNMTPLIDVTFLLMVFFILAGSFASLDAVRLAVPKLYDTAVLDELKLANKAVINIPPHSLEQVKEDGKLQGKAASWQLSTARIRPGDTTRLVSELRAARADFADRKAKDPGLADTEFQVEVRADRGVYYSEVTPVLSAITQAGFARVHYVAYTSMDED